MNSNNFTQEQQEKKKNKKQFSNFNLNRMVQNFDRIEFSLNLSQNHKNVYTPEILFLHGIRVPYNMTSAGIKLTSHSAHRHSGRFDEIFSNNAAQWTQTNVYKIACEYCVYDYLYCVYVCNTINDMGSVECFKNG